MREKRRELLQAQWEKGVLERRRSRLFPKPPRGRLSLYRLDFLTISHVPATSADANCERHGITRHATQLSGRTLKDVERRAGNGYLLVCLTFSPLNHSSMPSEPPSFSASLHATCSAWLETAKSPPIRSAPVHAKSGVSDSPNFLVPSQPVAEVAEAVQ
jgi:hypothetical protein